MLSQLELISKNRTQIISTLSPLVSKSCVLYDVPYYKNIGDILIWQGEIDLLNDMGVNVLDMASYRTCTYPNLDSNVCILFNGGGNLGDLYPEHMDFLKTIVLKYPNNRVIVLSQTVHYISQDDLKKDFGFLAKHSDFYFIARDNMSFDLIKPWFNDKALVLPDMAFCIKLSVFDAYILDSKKKSVLRISRNDCEAKNHHFGESVRDWPVFEQRINRFTIVNSLFSKIWHIKPLRIFLRTFWNYYAYNFFRFNMIKIGVQFISPYDIVISDRLHGAILSILLGKNVVIVDNSYGKNKSFFNSWLKETDRIHLE